MRQLYFIFVTFFSTGVFAKPSNRITAPTNDLCSAAVVLSPSFNCVITSGTFNGVYCYKHGGAYGTNTLFIAYPELNIGLCIIVNITGANTFGNLYESATKLVEDLETPITANKPFGYRLTSDQVVFTYQFNPKIDLHFLKSLAVVGSFNGWNPNDLTYQLHSVGQHTFELRVPKSQFEKGKTYAFKFVMNQSTWLEAPSHSLNLDGTPDQNLTFTINN